MAKSEFDNCFGSPAAFPAALAGSPSAALPFSTFPAGTDCRWRERGSMESWVRPFPLLGKKGKQSNLFPVFITNIDLGIREEQLQTFWETYAPYTWRGMASPVGLLDPGLSIVFLRGGLLIATEILLPSTSMPSIFSTA